VRRCAKRLLGASFRPLEANRRLTVSPSIGPSTLVPSRASRTSRFDVTGTDAIVT
jgi:hypothetical protein